MRFLSNLFKTPERTCRECEYYSEYYSPSKLLPDKTVIKSKLECISCEKMDAKLNDVRPCELFEERSSNTCMSLHALRIHLYPNDDFPGMKVTRKND